MRNMSFSLTTRQFLDGSKTVTRRLGWANLKAGEHFMAVEMSQGLKLGEHPVNLGECVCVSNTPVTLCEIDKAEVNREGFPEFTPWQFVTFFMGHMRCNSRRVVNRIEFRRVTT